MKPFSVALPIAVLSAASLSAQEPADVLDLDDELEPLLPSVTHRVDLEYENLTGRNIDVNSVSVAYELDSEKWTLGGSFGHTNHSIDFIGSGSAALDSHRNENTQEGSISLGYKWNDNHTTTVSGSYYDGFTDFRSLWISEFFRQGFELFPQYEEARPEGFSLNLAHRWEYHEGLSALTVSAGFSRDTIAPGWEIDAITFIGAERTNDQIETISGSIIWETTLSKRLRTQQTIRLSEVTARQLRVQYRTNWNYLLTDSLVLRGELGGAYERPEFEAYFGGLTLLWQATPEWEFGLGARTYSDTGEITTGNFNSAAPGFDSSELSLSGKWQKDDLSVRLTLGYFDTRFDPSTGANEDFAALYSNRELLTVRFALTKSF